MKPYAQEEDVLVFLDPAGERKYLYVYNTEELVLENKTSWASTNATATATLSTYTQETGLEPNKTTAPEVEVYQVRVGIKGGGLVYAELNAGEARRGTWKQPRPGTANYFVGYLDDMMSPYEDPRFEMWLTHNQYPAFAVYNPWAVRKANVHLRYIGKKLRCFDLTHVDTPKKTGVPAAVLANILNGVRAGTYPHRAITPRGIVR